MSILNQPKILQDDVTNKLRNAIMHRGLWMGLILKEAKERGLDWEQIGIDGEMLATPCDIAMSGDRAICSRFDEFEFHIGKTIAQGHRVCEVCFTRKRQLYRQ